MFTRLGKILLRLGNMLFCYKVDTMYGDQLSEMFQQELRAPTSKESSSSKVIRLDREPSLSTKVDGLKESVGGELFLFQTKAQRVAAKMAAEREDAERARQLVRESAVAGGKLTILAKRDPRFQQYCNEHFPDQPALAEYLCSSIIAMDGSLQVLHLISNALSKTFSDMKDDVPASIIDRMCVEGSHEDTHQLVVSHWSMGGDKIQAQARELAYCLQGEVIPEENVPKDQWLRFGNKSITLDHVADYTRIFVCAYVMLLATQDAKCKIYSL